MNILNIANPVSPGLWVRLPMIHPLHLLCGGVYLKIESVCLCSGESAVGSSFPRLTQFIQAT